ncbi:glycosyltransferase family 2 protein [Pseudophaeobacter arcticus]|uniref:glycosyltransferase family 2 protein n=1 Tax=Pseudophaeobacter arcticus TaxID=385492 RepID=UPI0009FCEA26|nr:glycosyltransferase family 2 protein [Pseudophaeobacter arcticus]
MQSFLVQDTTVFRYTARFSQFPYANISFFDREQKNILFHLSLRQEDSICVCCKRTGEQWAAEKAKKHPLPKTGVEVTITFTPPHVTVALDGKNVFTFGRSLLGRSYPNLDKISFVSYQGGISAADVDFGDSVSPKLALGALSRNNQTLLNKGRLCLSNRLELRARLKVPPQTGALTLDLPGESSPPKVILYPDTGKKGSLGNGSQVSDVIVLLPGRVWQGRAQEEALDLGLVHADGSAACPRLLLTREDLVKQIELIIAETDLGSDSLAAMQVFEHVQFGGLLDQLSSQSRASLASAQRFFGLSDYIRPTKDMSEETTNAAKAPELTPRDPVVQAHAEFGQAMWQKPERDPLEVLSALLTDLPKNLHPHLFLALSEFFCHPSRDFGGFHGLFCREGFGSSLSPEAGNLFKNSALLPFLFLEERHDQICPTLRSLIAPTAGWIVTPALAWLMRRTIAAEGLNEKTRENILNAYMDLIDKQASNYWGRAHCTALTEVAVLLLQQRRSFADDTQQLILNFVIRTYGLSRQFWHQLDEQFSYDTSPELAALRQAFAGVEAAPGHFATSAPKDRQDRTELAQALAFFQPYQCRDLRRVRRELLGPSGVEIAPAKELNHQALIRADVVVEEAALRHMAFPGAEPVHEDLVPVTATALSGFYRDVPRAPYFKLQIEVSQRLQALLQQAATQPVSPDQIAELGTDLHLLSARRSQFLGLGFTLALLRGLSPYAQQTEAIAALLKQLKSQIQGVDDTELSAFRTATAPRLALVALRDTAGTKQLFEKVCAILPTIADDLPAPRPLPKAAPDMAGSPLFDTIVTVFSCLPNLNSRIPAMRSGWLALLEALGVPYVIIVGNGDGSKDGDIVHVDAPDNYEGLPQKTLATIRWVYENTRFSHLLKIDDDCFLNPDVFFHGQSYRKFDYYGRILTRRPGDMDRSWHNEKSSSDRGRLELDKSPEPSTYTDGGTGYALSRTAMAAAIAAEESPEGQHLIQMSFMEDKMLGDLLAQQGIHPIDEDYRTSIRRRTWGKATPVSRWVNSFDASRAAPVALVHLDEHDSQAQACDTLAAATLTPKKIWPSYQDAALVYQSNALELISSEERLDAARNAEVAVVACMHNEMFMLPQFLAHYRRLGVDSFLIADNCSDDGTLEFLMEQPDVALFSVDTDYSLSQYGAGWQQAMMAAFRTGKWTLIADTDELLVWQKNQTQTLPDLLKTPEFQGVDAARIFMLDMYPKASLGKATFKTNPFDEAGYTDSDPFLANWTGQGPFSNMPTWTSAVRHRLIAGSRTDLFVAQKIALLKYQPWMRLSAGYHFLADVQLSSRELIFGHFKYNADFHRKAQIEVSRRQHFNDAEEYRKYLALMSEGRDVIYQEGLSVPWHQASFVKSRIENNG